MRIRVASTRKRFNIRPFIQTYDIFLAVCFFRRIEYFVTYRKMGADDELSTPILHSDDDEGRNRRTFNDDELNAESGVGGCCCNPSSTCHRFIALILMCLVGFGNFVLILFYTYSY